MKGNQTMSRIFRNLTLMLGALLLLATSPAFAQRTPDWMVGKFEGYNRKYGQTITIRMNREGNLIVTNVKKGETVSRMPALYRRGLLNIDEKDYMVERTDEGFRTIQSSDRENRVIFKRIGDYDENWQGGRDPGRIGNTPPDWLDGTFE